MPGTYIIPIAVHSLNTIKQRFIVQSANISLKTVIAFLYSIDIINDCANPYSLFPPGCSGYSCDIPSAFPIQQYGCFMQGAASRQHIID